MHSPFRAQLFFCQSLLLSFAAKTKGLSHGLGRDYHHQKMEDSFSPHQHGVSFYGNHGYANWWWGTRVRSGIGSKETTATWITLYKNTQIITSLSSGGHSQERRSGGGYKDSYSQPGNHEIHSQTVHCNTNKEILTRRPWPPCQIITVTLVRNYLKHSTCCGKVTKTPTGRLRWEVMPAVTCAGSGSKSANWQTQEKDFSVLVLSSSKTEMR